MPNTIKMKAKANGEIVEVKALISHPMESGLRKDSATGELIPAHWIKQVSVTAGEKTVLTANWGTAVSKNPYLAFSYKGGKAGDKVKLTWTDSKGETDSAEIDVV